MTLTIQLSAEAERWLTAQAAAAGTTPEAIVTGLVEQSKPREKTFAEICEPIRREFEASGMTEEELDALVEEARQEIWEEKQRRGQ